MAIDQGTLVRQQMLEALRRFARAVSVITTDFEGRRYAMAATAVCEVSLDPPSMLVCVNRAAALFVPLSQGAPFCINILEASQQAISVACGGSVRGEERFAVGQWRKSEQLGLPCLEGAQASLVCENEASILHGTHGVFLGRVVEVATSGPVNPLIYADGSYEALELDRPASA